MFEYWEVGNAQQYIYGVICPCHIWFAFNSCLPSEQLNSLQADKLQYIQRARELHVGQGQNNAGGYCNNAGPTL